MSCIALLFNALQCIVLLWKERSNRGCSVIQCSVMILICFVVICFELFYCYAGFCSVIQCFVMKCSVIEGSIRGCSIILRSDLLWMLYSVVLRYFTLL